ncbi:rod shape-determining protein RodA [Corticibacter populi]|uniref:Peptidoglycan glycosyltransferase MrdB n=1 Tax=Corticibacter populi TaxID=1550736 RepID=A0A3M6QJ67_9BURK|nr:rod shape-determining protein RodA [Corticibacter populi]RMX03015.1 rod shape-determining protein RodA [Corticibacter populi]RZS33447.1 cell elongation-specific peptidoglycan biosynthesis regulator RodA [Corticibacter populi]
MSVTLDKTPWHRHFIGLFLRFDGWLILAILFLAGLGLLAMYSAGYDHGTRFIMHGRNMLLAAGILFVVAQIPPQRLMQLAVPIYLVGVLLLLGVEFFGITRKGAQRWVNIGIVIQPSEIMKIAMPLILAWWFQLRAGQLRWPDFIVAGLLLMVPVGLILHQPDLGTSLLVLAAGLSVIFFAGLSWKLVAPPVILGVVGIVLIILYEPSLCQAGVDWVVLHDYQKTRVCTLLDPYRDPLGKGFHIIQGMIAIGSGGLWGKGFMAGTQTHLEFIPERTTDFIYAAYAEEFGLVGTLALIIGFLFLIWRAMVIAARAKSLFGRLLAASIAMIFFTYAFVNMGMVMGVLPVVGVPLPFISYGGTAMVTLGLALGMLMSIAREQVPEKPSLEWGAGMPSAPAARRRLRA